MAKTLIVITGPTGVGKTGKAIELAQSLGTEIVSADSRQLYRDIPIGTAAPTAEELAMVKHHFVGILGLEEYYSAAQFEVDALEVIKRIFAERDYAARRFLDTAYCVPTYLKDFQATKPKKLF